jgi:starvation-inducible DNA-binding protein
MEKINIGLGDEQRAGIADTLNRLLADEHVLYVKTRNYHWNVVDPRFNDLHKFFEEQYTKLAEIIDEVAENVRQFGGFALGTMAQFTKVSRLKEQPGDVPAGDEMLRNLLNDHETVIGSLRRDIDKATDEYKAADAADFLTGVLEQHNKMAWMLRSFLPADRKVKVDRELSNELVGSRR